MAELPQGDVEGAVATVFVGDFGTLSSPARHDTPQVGVDLTLHRPTTVLLRPDFEYTVVVLEGAVGIDGEPAARETGLPRPRRDELHLDVREPTRAVLGRGAVRGADRDVVELRGPHPRRDRRRLCLLGPAGRPVRAGPVPPCR